MIHGYAAKICRKSLSENEGMLGPLLALMLAAAQETPGSVSGRVVDAATGQSLAGATVTVCHGRGVPEPRCDSLQARTDGDGVFRIDKMAAGVYDAYASAAGHLESEKRVPFSVSAGNEAGPVTIQLQREGSIRGRVLNPDGTAVMGATVEALSQTRPHHFAVVSRTSTNAQGFYILARLVAGTYTVAVERRDSAVYFLPGTVDPDAAQPVQVNSGQDIESPEIRLRLTGLPAISGKVEGVDEAAPAGKLRLLLYSRSFEIEGAQPRSAQVQADGHFSFRNVGEGEYTIVLEAQRFGTRQQSNLAIQILQKQDLSITDSDVRGLTLSSLPLGTIAGRIQLEHATTEELAGLAPALTLAEPFRIHEFRTAEVAADGSFSFAACQPARYEVRLKSSSEIFPAELDVNGHPASSRFIDLSAGTSATMAVRYERGTASVTGVLRGKTMVGVYLIPNGWTPDDWRAVRWGRVGKDGNFSVANLSPGRYSVVATDKASNTPDEVSSLARDGGEVEVAAGDRKQIEVDGSP